MNNLRKIVFSKTLKKVTWNNSRLLAATFGRSLEAEQQPGKDIVILAAPNSHRSFCHWG